MLRIGEAQSTLTHGTVWGGLCKAAFLISGHAS